jgi:O-antigen ligase
MAINLQLIRGYVPAMVSWLLAGALAAALVFPEVAKPLFRLVATLGLLSLFWKPQRAFSNNEKILVGLVTAFFAVSLLSNIVNGFTNTTWGRIFLHDKFLFAIGFLLLFRRTPLRLDILWFGIVAGAFTAGGSAVYEVFYLQLQRAGLSTTFPTYFGPMSQLYGLLALAPLFYLRGPKKGIILLALLALASGLLASWLSISRGGWLALPVIMVILAIYTPPFARRLALAGIGGIIVVMLAAWQFSPSVQQRVEKAIVSSHSYFAGDVRARSSSLGLRFEMWRGAWLGFKSSPLLGISDGHYKAYMKRLADKKILPPGVKNFASAHNEFMHTALTRGLLGLVVLVGLFFWPFAVCHRGLRQNTEPAKQALYLAGIILIASYLVYSLSESVFTHTLRILIYSAMIAVVVFFSRDAAETTAITQSNRSRQADES